MGDSEKMEQLTENLNKLSQALVNSETRYQRIEKIFRWMGMGFAALFALVVLGQFDVIGKTYATNAQSALGGSPSVFSRLDKLLGQIEKALKPGDLDTIVQGKVKMATLAIAFEQGMTIDNWAAWKNVLGGVGNASILATRFKQDSDILRAYMLLNQAQRSVLNSNHNNDAADKLTEMRYLYDPYATCKQPGAAEGEVTYMICPNGPLDGPQASPAMAIHEISEDLGKIDNYLATMSYGVGSTLGRMGDWMP